MSENIKLQIEELEVLAKNQQNEGKYLECLDSIEQLLSLKKDLFGEQSKEYHQTTDQLCFLCNTISMIFLKKEKFDVCLEFLKKAELLCEQSVTYKTLTLSNLAAFYRKQNNPKKALKYLQYSLKLELTHNCKNNVQDTHLNLCAVLSQLNRHQEALQNILLSVIHLQNEIINEQYTNEKYTERVAVLCIAYHNLGVELEFLKRFDEALITYKKAVEFAKKNLGEQHPLTSNLQSVLNSAQEQIFENAKQYKKDVKVSKNIDKLKNQIAIYQKPDFD